MKKPLSAGGNIETHCTRCRRVLNHTIVAMVGEKVVRVECNTCHGTHNYHPVKAAKEPVAAKTAQKKVAAPRKARVDPETAAREEWAELEPSMDPAQAIPYDMNRAYRAKNLLLHPQFGLGIVLLVLPPNKIEVLFRDGKKRLRCG
ncbi:MAG TPA: hypothetical protein VIU40_03355 [Geobacteraceae bacterium]